MALGSTCAIPQVTARQGGHSGTVRDSVTADLSPLDAELLDFVQNGVISRARTRRREQVPGFGETSLVFLFGWTNRAAAAVQPMTANFTCTVTTWYRSYAGNSFGEKHNIDVVRDFFRSTRVSFALQGVEENVRAHVSQGQVTPGFSGTAILLVVCLSRIFLARKRKYT